jgi:hypothetical protein
VSRGAGLCGLCGGVRRGRGARVAMPIADCVQCRVPVCAKHSVPAPEEGGYRCNRCVRGNLRQARGGG